MKIELQPHRGKHIVTRQEVDLGQDRIFLNGLMVGYVSRKPGAPVCLIERLNAETQAAIKAYVAKERGAEPSKVAMPPAVPVAEAVVETDAEE